MKNTKEYTKPNIEIIDLCDDIIVTSDATTGEFGGADEGAIRKDWIF